MSCWRWSWRRWSEVEGLHPANILTNREREVMFYLVKGLSNKEIAASLNISADTVRSYVHVILEKLGVSNRTQAALYAVENRLFVE